MLTEFGKIFVFILLAVLFVGIAIVAARLVRPNRPTKEKKMIYECGENAQGSPWIRFNIRFYVVALIFLIFDVEVVMLFPWAVVYKEFSLFGFMAGFIFLVILGLGMAYEWRKGDLEWSRPLLKPPKLDDLIKEKYTREEINQLKTD